MPPPRCRSASAKRSSNLLLTLLLLVPTVSALRATPVANTTPAPIDFQTQVRPILEQRCTVCHGCYDAPCQLKLTAGEGIARGSSKTPVYESTRLISATPSRLFEDESTTEAWRRRDFYPVVPEAGSKPEDSLMYRMLKLKSEHPLPSGETFRNQFEFTLDRKLQCPAPDEFTGFATRHPLWGMPYALPALTAQEQTLLETWVLQGAKQTPTPSAPIRAQRTQEEWEKFLNGDSLKQRLMSRYLYEHLFLAHLYFPEQDSTHFYKLVRSSTPPGQPLRIVATRRPYDDPGVQRVYYRLRPEAESLLSKTHMPYALHQARMRNWQRWFLAPQINVDTLPSYDPKTASNPFVTFQAIPAQNRYRFLLDEAQYTIMGFIKGPVCRGQVALNVIDDHFWVFFQNPDKPQSGFDRNFMATQYDHLELPAADGDIFTPLKHWRKYALNEKRFLEAQADYIVHNDPGALRRGLDYIWDGEDSNDNAALTVFRHFDSASVLKGLRGGAPKTAWLITYPRLERIHYLLVAGYDVFGNAGHQFVTRIYMDFLRMESEASFLHLLPPAARQQELDYWYRGARKSARKFMVLPALENLSQPAIAYRTATPKRELYTLLQQRLKRILKPETPRQPALANFAAQLAALQGTGLSYLPEVVMLEIRSGRSADYLTLLHNRAHSNLTSLFREHANLLPAEDTLSVLTGIQTAYPNAFLRVSALDLPLLSSRIATLRNEDDIRALFQNFGLGRTHPGFWPFSDRLHAALRDQDGVNFGLLDFSRLDPY